MKRKLGGINTLTHVSLFKIILNGLGMQYNYYP